MMSTLSKALTWDELANEFDAALGGNRPARTLPMEAVFDWAVQQKDRFVLDEVEGTIHKLLAAEGEK